MALPFIDRLPAAEAAGFARAVSAMAVRLGIEPDWAMVVMYRESELKPTARNPYSGATGLIQFMPKTAQGLGTSTDALYRMSATGQLFWVEKYWREQAASIGRKPASVYDLYLLTLHPASVGKSVGSVVFATGTAAYRQNNSLDQDHKGYVTVADVHAFVDRAGGLATCAALSLGGLVVASLLGFLTYKYVLPLKPIK